jgi:hypothetical protein
VRKPPAPPRLILLIIAVLAAAAIAAALAGCGGSNDQTVTVGQGQTITVGGDVHGFYDELETILDQFPYQHWYVGCVMKEARKLLDPKEAKELEELPEAEREERSTAIAAKAGPACEKSGRPVIDPNASSKQLELLRAGSLPAMTELAESNGYSPTQVACVQSFYEKLPNKKLIELRNGTKKVREGILVSVFRPCAQLK